MGAAHKVIVWTDHANLQYYRHPQKINWHVAQYITVIGNYNLELKHVPGTKNHEDALSRRPDHDDGTEDNDAVVALPDKIFTCIIQGAAFDEQIHDQQKEHKAIIDGWKKRHQLQYRE